MAGNKSFMQDLNYIYIIKSWLIICKLLLWAFLAKTRLSFQMPLDKVISVCTNKNIFQERECFLVSFIQSG